MEKLIDNNPKKGSFCFETNILYRKENIYLMDNHRMAAWCWANHIDDNKKYTIIHIDKHFDTLGNQIDLWTNSIKSGLKELSFQEYNNIEYQKNKFEKYKVFSWDNYIPIFHHYYSNLVKEYVFYTHNQGSIPKNLEKHITHCTSYNLINNLFAYFSESDDRLIINLDIDYFFCDNPTYFIFFSDYAIERIIEDIMRLVDNKKNILTIALSPECCGGWENSLEFMRKYFSKYEIKID